MNVERKEPTLSGLGSAREEPVADSAKSVGSDNSSHYSPKSGASAQAGSIPPPAQQRRRPAPVSTVQAKASPLVPLALILALTGLGLAGFSYWQLVTAQHQVSAADKRITELENRLALSDDESSQSVTALQQSLREAREQLQVSTAEIRKLWDTRNVNREAIAANKDQIAAATKSAQGAATAAAAAQKLAKSQEANWKALSDSVALQTEQLGMVSDLSDAQEKQVRDLVERASRLDGQMQKLQSDLVGRVKKNEQAIEAIDAYRLSVNRDILDLKKKLNPQ